MSNLQLQPVPTTDPNNSANTSGVAVDPDQETIDRIKNLAFVGSALNETASDTTFMTNFYIAKESLLKFKAGIDKLNLPPESKQGMYDLINYLDQKIDKRIKYADTSGEKPMT